MNFFYPLSGIKRWPEQLVNKVVYYSETFKELSTEGSMKERIIAWLRSLTQQQLNQVFSYTSLYRVTTLLKMYVAFPHDPLYSEFYLYNNSPYQVLLNEPFNMIFYQRMKYYSCDRTSEKYHAYEEFLKFVHVADYEYLFDTIVLRGDLEKILSCLELITENKLFTRIGPLDENQEEEYYESQLKDTKLNQIENMSEHIAREMEKAIQIRFLQFDQNSNFTKQDSLFELPNVKIPYDIEEVQLVKSIKPEGSMISDAMLVQNYYSYLKNHNFDENKIKGLLNNLDQVFYVPIHMIHDESILASKIMVSKYLLKHYPLKPQVAKEFTSAKKHNYLKQQNHSLQAQINKKNESLANLTLNSSIIKKMAGQQKQVNPDHHHEIHQYFTGAPKQSAILPKEKEQIKLFADKGQQQSQKQNSSSYIIQQDNEYHEWILAFVGQIKEESIRVVETDRKFKQEQKKKQKAQLKQHLSESTTNNTDSQLSAQQPHSDNDKQDLEKPTKSQKKKVKRKEQLQRKQQKDKQLQQEQNQKISEINDMIIKENGTIDQLPQDEEPEEEPEPEKEPSVKEEQFNPQSHIIVEDGEFMEVERRRPKPKQQQQKTSAKKKRPNKASFVRDDISLDEQTNHRAPQLKKSVSQAQQKQQSADESKTYKYKIQKTPQPIVKQVVVPEVIKKNFDSIDKHVLQKIYRQIITYKVSQDVSQIVKQERDNFLRFNQARGIAIERIKYIVQSLFRISPFVKAEIFGSYATDLSLEDSDVDIVITGFNIYNKQQVYEPMRSLNDQLSLMKWTTSSKHIFTASVPVLKVEIDPSIAFLQYHKQGYQQSLLMNRKNPDELNLRFGEASKIIQLDITFQIQPTVYQPTIYSFHIGMQSTDYTKRLLQDYVGFAETVIILKKLLKLQQLNDSYTGGISSFCLTLMVQAIGHQNSVGEKLMEFLHRYSKFEPDKEAICIDSEGSCFVNIDEHQPVIPLTIYSPFNGQVINTYANQIQTILQFFKSFYLHLLSKSEQIEQSLLKIVDSDQLLSLYHNNQLNILIDQIQWPNNNIVSSYLM